MDTYLLETKIGTMAAKANSDGVCELYFIGPCDTFLQKTDNPHLKQLKVELDEYFEGKRREFSVKLSPKGTPFQMSVWKLLRQIPYGKTVSYAKESCLLGYQKAARAVANANGKNPILILIPCHRVIASSGKIGGYSGGVEKKEFLLELERSFNL